MRAKLLYGGRRIGACSDLALPSGTLGPSARSVLPSRGGGCGGRRGARTHLTSFSFRAFRFATRCPGIRRSCCVGPCCNSHQPPASGSENRRSMYPKLPRAKGFPKGQAFPSLTSTRKCQLSPAGGRRSALAQTDPPNIFSFPPGAAHFLFDVSKRKWGVHPRWTSPPGGSQTPEAAARRPAFSPVPFGAKGNHLTSRSRPPASAPRCTAHSGTAGSNPAHTPPQTHPAPQTPPGRR